MNRLVDEAQAAKDAAMNDNRVTLAGDAPNAAQGNLAPLSTVLARVCTCQITDDNRLERDECPRHGDTGGLLRDVAWDAISGNGSDLGARG